MCRDEPFQVLWAPWRIQYILEHAGRKERECVFCSLPKRGDDEESLILYRGKYNYIVLNKYPYNTAHLMIVPYRHVASPEELEEDELVEIARMIRATMRALKKEYRPHGFNIGANIGECAGAGIAGHFHIHVLPRWCGDTNYTFILARTKVLPESLEVTYRRLKPLILEECREECGE